jgi:hypothetical protein
MNWMPQGGGIGDMLQSYRVNPVDPVDPVKISIPSTQTLSPAALNRRIHFHLRPVRDSVAVANLTNDEAALAQMAVVHGGSAPVWRLRRDSHIS